MYSRGAWLTAVVSLTLIASVPEAQATVADMYDNSINDTGQTAVLSGNVWADDLHMLRGGLVSHVGFGYVANGASQATISFYANDASNSIWPGGGAPLLYSNTIDIDPGSSGLGLMVISPAVQLPQNVWYAIKFNHFNAEVPLYDPPVTGSSFDVLVRGDGSFFTGGAPAHYGFEGAPNNFQVHIGFVLPAPGPIGLLGASMLLVGARPRRR